jgi:preprotein translocase subunit SecG
MATLLTVLHVLFCLFLILVILLQTGKGGGMGVAFGGSGSSVFGPRGVGSFIGKMTGVVATLFMLTSLSLAYLSSSGGSGVADKAEDLAASVSGKAEEVDLDEIDAGSAGKAASAEEEEVKLPEPAEETPAPGVSIEADASASDSDGGA